MSGRSGKARRKPPPRPAPKSRATQNGRRKAWTRADVEAGVGRALQPYDWIEAALQVLVERGADAVRITLLAELLGASRGSFYWHFRDRAELLAGLRTHWRERNTAAVLDAVNAAQDLRDGVLALFTVWADPARFDPRLDSAMRDWARQDGEVRRQVQAADAERVAAIAGLFEHAGYPRAEAFVRARVIYFTQVGYYAMAIDETLVERIGYLEAYFEVFTGRRLDARAAQAFRKQHLPRGV